MQPKPSVSELRELLDYDPDTGALHWKSRPVTMFKAESYQRSWNTRHAGKEAFTVGDQGYRKGMIFRRTYMAHIIAWAIHYGRWPAMWLDHINGIRHDNRIENLREVSRSENARNARLKATNTSGANGVIAHGKRFRAYINIHLGIFDTLEEAVAARKAAEAEIGGYHPNHGRIQAFGDENGVRWSDPEAEAA